MRLDLTGPRPRVDLDALVPPPTAAQRAALAFDREVVVAAGAGAGKTHTLSLRYVLLLLELAARAVEARPADPRPDVESVLVLTFTEMAAEEMAGRCHRRLLGLCDAVRGAVPALDARYGAGYGRSLAAAVDHLVDRFDRARISTFHGFCHALLREFPAQTGTPPGFEVLADAAEVLALRDAAAGEAVDALARDLPEQAGPLVDAFDGRGGVVRAVCTALDAGERLRPRLDAYTRGQGSVDDLVAASDPSPDAVATWLRDVGLPVLSSVRDLAAPGGSPLLATLDALLARGRPLPDDPLARNALYEAVLGALLIKGKPRSLTHAAVMGTQARWPSTERHRQAKRLLEGAERLLGDWPARHVRARALPVPADRDLVRLLAPFARLVHDAAERLRARCRTRGVVDFAALQERAVAAVTADAGVRAALCRRFRYVMVDEFQDTDEGQWSLVRAIGRPDDLPADRVFLVGDAKQAIYGFRGGDVTVFERATAELGVAPVILHDNFRSRDGLITWFNGFFASALRPAGATRATWEAAFDPLHPGRGAPGGSVTIVPHTVQGAAAGAEAEAEAVARLVAGEILPGRGRYAGTAEGAPPHLGDLQAHPTPPIAVLLRRRTWLATFEAALGRHGVPYVVASGVGFWARPEVVDLVNAVHALATGDPLSLVGALRSPLLSVSDTAIHHLERGRTWLPTGLASFGRAPLRAGAPADLVDADARWRELLAARDRVPVSALLRRIVDTCAGWHAYALDDPWDQAAANVARLIELAGRFDGRGPEGLREVAALLLGQVEDEPPEAEAAVSPTAARVVVMTVHAAKGLEFPVVVVPMLGATPTNDQPRLIVRRAPGPAPWTGWDLACRVPHAEPDPAGTGALPPLRWVDPGRRVALDLVRRAEEAAEDRRLLYVAATRARDHLVLLGEHQRTAPAGSWMELVADHHGLPPLPTDGLLVRDLDALLSIPVVVPSGPVAGAGAPPDAARRLAALAVPSEVEISPSSLDRFTECPARWALRHVHGVPEAEVGAASGALGPHALASARGDVIHSLLEDDVADDLDVARARWVARAREAGVPMDEITRGFRTLRDHLARAAHDPRLAAVLAAEGFSELGFRAAHGPVVLRGQIDRLFRDPESGEWVVLDYKSESVADGLLVAAARHERQLRAYAWAASRVLQAHGQPAVRRGMLYFTAVGQFYVYPPWTDDDMARFEAVLDGAGRAAIASWDSVRAQSIRGDVPRPCERCGYRGRGCPGVAQPAVSRPERPALSTHPHPTL